MRFLFSDNVQKNGGHVFFAKDGNEASAFIKQLAIKKNVHHVVKSKSMVTTEIGLDKELLTIPGLSLMETDLAEFFKVIREMLNDVLTNFSRKITPAFPVS